MTSVAQLLFERMAQYDQLTALVCSGKSFSYPDLSKRACFLAAAKN
jgi:acyl-CoA synthetase (AMP-forming)/AMP-acid ligase II|tara:strand:+ start:407 stop:544 length:138 start_codon:yes stop_codon:yes gene_type:complete